MSTFNVFALIYTVCAYIYIYIYIYICIYITLYRDMIAARIRLRADARKCREFTKGG